MTQSRHSFLLFLNIDDLLNLSAGTAALFRADLFSSHKWKVIVISTENDQFNGCSSNSVLRYRSNYMKRALSLLFRTH